MIWPNNWHLELCCQTNGDMQRKSGSVVGLLGLMMEIYISWCHSHIIMKQFIEARTVFSSHICVVGMKMVNPKSHPI